MQVLPVLAVLAFFSLLAKLWRKIQYELDLAELDELDEFDVLEELDAELALSSLVARFWGRLSCVENEDDEIIESINQIGDIVAAVISLYENGMNVRGKFYSYNANNKCISKLVNGN